MFEHVKGAQGAFVSGWELACEGPGCPTSFSQITEQFGGSSPNWGSLCKNLF